MLDNTDIRELNIKWLRSNIGIVSQEPVLFDCSIRDNITYGLSMEERENVTMDRIEAAAKSSNIHHFISSLPKASLVYLSVLTLYWECYCKQCFIQGTVDPSGKDLIIRYLIR